MTYAEAKQYCTNDATELAYFSDKYEQAFVQTTMYANDVSAIWFGLSKDTVSICDPFSQNETLLCTWSKLSSW